MPMPDVADRVLNPAIILTMMLSGVAYGWWFLWAINIRDGVRLWAAAVMPGVVFFLIITAVRYAQGTAASLYLLVLVDWLAFSNVACLTAFARRRLNRRKEG